MNNYFSDVLIFDKALVKLLQDEPFLAGMLQRMRRIYSEDICKKYKVFTAAVTIIGKRFTLLVHPTYFKELRSEERLAILEHEILHILHDHLYRGKNRHPELFNAAADIAINPSINNLPARTKEELKKAYNLPDSVFKHMAKRKRSDGRYDTCLLPHHYGLPEGKTSEWYYDKIISDEKLSQQFKKQKIRLCIGGKGEGKSWDDLDEETKKKIKSGEIELEIEFDDHDKWDDASENDKNVMDEDLRRIVSEALQEAKERSNNIGNIAGNMVDLIDSILTSTVDWKVILRSFFQVATRPFRRKSKKRPCRRYGIGYPGNKTDYELNLAVITDTSGSMSNDDLTLCFGEINKIMDAVKTRVWLIMGDHDVQEVIEYKKKLPKIEFKGRGGTDAEPWIRAAEKLGVDAAICLTDGYFYTNFKKSKIPLLWCITPGTDEATVNNLREAKIGKVIQMRMDSDE